MRRESGPALTTLVRERFDRAGKERDEAYEDLALVVDQQMCALMNTNQFIRLQASLRSLDLLQRERFKAAEQIAKVAQGRGILPALKGWYARFFAFTPLTNEETATHASDLLALVEPMAHRLRRLADTDYHEFF